MEDAIATERNSPRGALLRNAGWVCAVALALVGAVEAIENATLEVEHVDGEGWRAEGLSIDLRLTQGAILASLSVQRVYVEPLAQELRNVRIDCPQVELTATTLACRDAQVAVLWPSLGAQRLNASIVYARRDGALDVSIAGLRLDEGQASLSAALRAGGWSGDVRLQRVPLQRLLALARELKLPASLDSASASGLVTLSARARGAGKDLREAELDARLVDATANNDSGSLASEGLGLRLRADLRKVAGDLRFSTQVESAQGQAYLQPVFLDLGAHALALSAQGVLRGQALLLEHFTLDHSGVAQLSGSASIDLDHEQPLRTVDLDVAALEFPGAYASYFQPLLLDTSFKSMTTAGRISGRVRIEQGEPRSVDLTLDDMSLDDGAGSLAFAGLAAELHWRSDTVLAGGEHTGSSVSGFGEADRDELPVSEAGTVSHVRWRAGSVFGMALGASELQFSTAGRQFRLLRPARMPLLDGAIELDSFRIRNAGTPKVAFIVDARIHPISVQRLCQAFGWPEFGGRIAGEISNLRMRDGVVTLGTTLRAQVFDGEVTVQDLRLEQPFGQWPRFHSSISLDDLDLELVTRAFSFGRITGRLSGQIDGLRLFNWTPVAFDARLYTPPDDRSRHRISQRAVENIGSIGGGGAGVTAALSSGFLRFFDDFNYDRLGVSCRLENEVCVMDGIAPAPHGGYYLVRGRGLPRIDVIGSSRRVDWPRLVQQLLAVTESAGPVIE